MTATEPRRTLGRATRVVSPGAPRGPLRLPATGLRDRLARPLTDLRISVTDRCNFRCVYCMPKEVFGMDYAFRDRAELLTFEEILRIAQVGATLGVRKIRLTGGEPLLRRGIEELVSALAAVRTLDGGRIDLAMTTNGAALPVKARVLAAAGLDRVTISLDSLREERFRRINGVGFPLARVLGAVEAAVESGLGPVKVNTVLKRGVNEDEILDLAEYFRGRGVILRFIEFMDVGSSNDWERRDVVPSAEVIERISATYPLEPIAPDCTGETARRWRYRDGAGEIGTISSVTGAFCGSCSRARVSADGSVFTCLFATAGTDIRGPLREGATDAELAAILSGLWRRREDRYSALRTNGGAAERSGRIEMSYIGG